MEAQDRLLRNEEDVTWDPLSRPDYVLLVVASLHQASARFAYVILRVVVGVAAMCCVPREQVIQRKKGRPDGLLLDFHDCDLNLVDIAIST